MEPERADPAAIDAERAKVAAGCAKAEREALSVAEIDQARADRDADKRADARRVLSAAEILGAPDCEVLEVYVPEWNGVVHLRELAADVGLEIGDQIKALPEDRKDESLYILLAACLCTKDLEPLFPLEESAKLRTRNPKVLLRLQAAALKLQDWAGETAKTTAALTVVGGELEAAPGGKGSAPAEEVGES